MSTNFKPGDRVIYCKDAANPGAWAGVVERIGTQRKVYYVGGEWDYTYNLELESGTAAGTIVPGSDESLLEKLKDGVAAANVLIKRRKLALNGTVVDEAVVEPEEYSLVMRPSFDSFKLTDSGHSVRLGNVNSTAVILVGCQRLDTKPLKEALDRLLRGSSMEEVTGVNALVLNANRTGIRVLNSTVGISWADTEQLYNGIKDLT